MRTSRMGSRVGTFSSRLGILGSLGMVLVVGLAIATESQQLVRTSAPSDTRNTAATSRPALPVTLARTGSASEHAARASTATAPVWKPGFEWHYRWSDPRGSGTYIRTITGEDAVNGMPAYVMRTESRRIFWDQTDLSWLMETVNGQVESQAAPAYRKFIWPLEPRKTWEARYSWTHPGEGKTEDRVRRHRVVGVETLQVPAGSFQTLRVVVTDSAGKKLSEYWYGPEARWLVKERTYLAQGVRDRELIYLSLWPRTPANP